MAKELKVEEDAVPPDGLKRALALLPGRLVKLAIAAGKPTREAIAAVAGRTPAQAGRWLRYEGLVGIEAEAIINLEEGYGLPPGTLLQTEEGSIDMSLTPFPHSLRCAVRACIELTGAAGVDVIDAAREAVEEFGDPGPKVGTPVWWLGQLLERLKARSRSGEHPSVRALLAASEVQ